ncbi:MAG TPA: hypothetical protein VJ983_05970, partial [candidate division Zixibacteria bacterium]|nr:hypothetical protein [candidate division Zixibacteria bacterium]
MNNDYLTNAIENFRRVTNEMLEALGQEPLSEPEIRQGTIVFSWNGNEQPDAPAIGYYISSTEHGRYHNVDVYGTWELFSHVAPVTPEDLA